MHSLHVAIDAPRRLPNRERPRPWSMARNIFSERFAVMTWNSNSGVAKLMRGALLSYPRMLLEHDV